LEFGKTGEYFGIWKNRGGQRKGGGNSQKK
jgi:hypothetical protein